MKKVLFAFVIGLAFVACKNESKKTVEISEEKTVEVQGGEEVEVTVDKNLPTEYIWWNGSKAIGGGHEGKIQFSDVTMEVKDNKLIGGTFVADLNTLTTDDLTGEEATKLVGHLKSADFLDVEKFPKATFKILEVKHPADNAAEGHELTGTLSLKNVTKTFTVPATVSVDDAGVVHLASQFSIDRSDFGISYGSKKKFTDLAKDKVINDMVDLKVVIN